MGVDRFCRVRRAHPSRWFAAAGSRRPGGGAESQTIGRTMSRDAPAVRPAGGEHGRSRASMFHDDTATSRTSDPVARRSVTARLRVPEPNAPASNGHHTLRVIVVDDHELARKGLVDLLQHRGISVVADAPLAADAISQAVSLAPDVLITDLCMPGLSAIEATHRLAAVAPEVHVLVLTGVDDDDQVMAALLAGACGYLLKTASIDQIVEGISATARGDAAISPAIASRLVGRLRAPNRANSPSLGAELTPRELEVLRLVALGANNRSIANTLHLSEYTVKQYISRILDKLKVGNRTQAAVRAVRCGLV